MGTVVGALLQLVIMKSVISEHRDLLLAVQGSNIWSGQNVQTFNSLVSLVYARPPFDALADTRVLF